MISAMLLTIALTQSYTCDEQLSIAERVMTLRQHDASQYVLENVYQGDQFRLDLIERAFKEPVQFFDSNKQDVIEEFGDEILSECLTNYFKVN